MQKAVAGRRRADFDIPATLTWACSHIGGWMAEPLQHISYVQAKIGLGVWLQSGCRKLGVGLIFCWANFAPALSLLWNHICVTTYNDWCWRHFFVRFYPCVHSVHVWMHLNGPPQSGHLLPSWVFCSSKCTGCGKTICFKYRLSGAHFRDFQPIH